MNGTNLMLIKSRNARTTGEMKQVNEMISEIMIRGLFREYETEVSI